MSPTAPNRWAYGLSLAAIAVFVVSIGIAALRLFEIERDLSRGIPEDLVWHATQAQFEAVRLGDAAGRFAIGAADIGRDDLRLRLDILISRIDVLRKGDPAQRVAALGEGETVAAAERDTAALEAALGETLLHRPTAAQGLREAARALALTLRDITNRLMLAERAYTLDLAARRQGLLLESLVYGVGILVSGAVLALSLLRGLRERARAEAELARHRDHLEDMVAVRTADLVAAEQRLVSAIDSAPDGLAAYGPEGWLVHANQHIRDLIPHYPTLFATGSHVQTAAEELARLGVPGVLEAPEDTDFEVRIAEGCWCRVSIRRMPDGGTVLRLADVTPYIDAAHALEEALARAQGLTDLYRSFVSMVSHQFRTPMAIIDAAAQRLLRRADSLTPDELRDRAGKIRSAVLRLTALMDSTLNAARLDAGEIAVEPRLVDLPGLIRFVAERQREIAPDRTLTLDLEHLPAAVRVDPTMMEQALANILSNAVKYSSAPEPVEIQAWQEDGLVHIAVRDQGIGIPGEDLPRLFERFFRARTAAGIAGTGIGLAFAHHIVRLHGGEISVSSRENEGSTFTIRLPGALPAGTETQLQGVTGA